jgi:glycosyltransferase involved in cell wall biosynthesis
MPRESRGAAGPGEPPLRVLMVLESNFTQKGGGGAESQVRTLSRYLQGHGHEVTIVTPMLPQGPQVAEEVAYGVPVLRLAYPKIPLVGAGVLAAKLAAYLWTNRDAYDAWHVHIGHYMGAVTCLVGELLGKPVVVKISGWWELEQGLLAARQGPLGKVAQRLLRRAGVVQAISTRIAREVERAGFPPERILVLPNAVDVARFKVSQARRAPGVPFTAVFVGRLVPEKGLATLLAAWAKAFAGRTDVRLLLVGQGPEEPALRAQAEQLGIAGQVELLGHSDKVEEVLARAHIGLLPSRIEGLSNTLLEFMSCGLPTVASAVSGSEDFVVTGRNGWLCPVGDEGAMAAALAEAAALPPDRLAALGRQARADVERAAAIESVVRRLLALYRGGRPEALPRELAEVG